ncbi:hypothetical protein F0562_012233 [Nyssa sinensis]|uniref:RNA-dependent RNA polymerase n=1 Tax=Nyssa sinensis TaxID=561372 RepID=A0A5J4ZSZ7_9ASTE|nr:hypothetical protein F0562_012233 [Nyssa sinensis]
MLLSIVVGDDRNGQWCLAQLAVLVAFNGGVYGTKGCDASNNGEVVTTVLAGCWCVEDNFFQWWHWVLGGTPCIFAFCVVEIGLLVSRDEFFVGWRGPPTGFDFLVDPFDGTCKFLFTKDVAFSLKGTSRFVVIKCNFKVEFLVRNINEIKQYRDISSLIIVLQLAQSPLLYYRTANDDIEESVPFDLLDDDDPWIRTMDFTPSVAIGRCITYRISIPPRKGLSLTKAMAYLREQRVPDDCPKKQLRISDEPDFGMPIFFDLLGSQPEEVNAAALQHLSSYRRPVFDAYKRLKLVQEWLLKNPKLLQRPRELDDIVEVRRNVAKCAARMGQCFSSTYATVEVPPNEVDSELPDTKRNGYVFSDGIGMITPDLVMEVAERWQLRVNPLCAYQIRYAGCKGVVACWPAKNDGIRLSLRPSMEKFESNHSILEICSWTQFQPGFLNRQIVTLLSTLNVLDEIFWNMQDSMISKLNQMLVDVDVAFDVLTASCAEQGIYCSNNVKCREKARIFVSSGRWLMGCLDELGVLEQGQCFIEVSNPSLENCFVKHGSRFSETKKNLEVIKGTVTIAKNPCLQPGDVRILEAVDVPGLHHLFDCLVFPEKGDRPHTNEASGSDLDGDLYFVTWDENLIPPSKRSWMPMEYAPAEVKLLTRPVNQTDIIDFFTRNIVNENLGSICNAHVVHADLSEYKALDEKCIKLAELAATAVDFPKSGKIVNMPFELKPKLYPDFMGKGEFQSYNSKKILGRLYCEIRDAYDKDVAASSELTFVPEDIPYDKDLEIPGSTDFIADAWNQKCSYDGQVNGLLGQYKVNREEEVVTGLIWSMPKYSSKKQQELKERLKHAYSALRKEFRQVFERMDSDFEQLSDD